MDVNEARMCRMQIRHSLNSRNRELRLFIFYTSALTKPGKALAAGQPRL